MMDFLHRFDSMTGDAVIVATGDAQLRGASFLDGREGFSTGQRLVRLKPGDLQAGTPARFIFHVGFCGSTLLSRLIDQPGAVLALREPQCLTDIASQRRAIRAGGGIADFAAIIGHALAGIGGGTEPVVIKPSNWINGALPDLVACRAIGRAVFLTCDRREFLTAAFRGGRDRLAFCARLASELADELAQGEAILAEQVAIEQDPLDRMARICVLLHAMQEALFERTMEHLAIPGTARLTLADLNADPGGTVARAQIALDLPVTAATAQNSAFAAHSKDPKRRYSSADSARDNDVVAVHHGERFDRALDWLGTVDFGAVTRFNGATSR